MIGKDADHPVSAIALVDSGADTTLIPRSFVPALGLSDADLVQATTGTGVGSTFQTWTAPQVSVSGCVAAYYDAGDGDGVQAHLWGPMFPLDPWFSDSDAFLLGRQDFFAAFAITFGPGREFHLDWDDSAASP